MLSAAVHHVRALVKRLTLPPITMKQRMYETRKVQTAKLNQTAKQRNYEKTKIRNNESAKGRDDPIQTPYMISG